MTSSTMRPRDYHNGYLHRGSSVDGRHGRSLPRSRAIAIQSSPSDKTNSRQQILEETLQSEAAAEYDWATWRMFHRITSYREKHPVNYYRDDDDDEVVETETTTDAKGADDRLASRSSHGVPTKSKNHATGKQQPPPSQIIPPAAMDLSEDFGAVFQLDL